MYSTRIVADSISPSGVRITSIEGVFARYLLAEINTHRRFSRNSASSRAIPVLVRAQSVWAKPFVPTFTKNKPGMAADEVLDESAVQAEQIWRSMASVSVMAAEKMARLEVHKQQANRILEPYVWHTALLTSTEWDNFLNLRDHAGAGSEMQKFARLVRELLEKSTPKKLEVGQWHLPYMDDANEFSSVIREMDMPPHEVLAAISVARCAAISFERQYVKKTVVEYLDRHDNMHRNGHWSPFEHQAVVASHREIIDHATFRPNGAVVKVTGDRYNAVGEVVPVGIGNFDVPWLQYRKLFANEAVFPRHGQETL